MGYFKNLEIAQQVEVADRTRRARRRETWQDQDIVTDKRTLILLLGFAVFFGVTTVALTIWVAWLV